MLPKWHIIWGAIFTAIIWFFSPGINLVYVLAIFLSTVFIDIDHYITAIIRNKHPSFKKAYEYHDKQRIKVLRDKEKGIKQKGDFHFFHTIEFHILIAALGMFYTVFFYIFLGMVFHSLLDLLYMLNNGVFYQREFFLSNWIRKKIFR